MKNFTYRLLICIAVTGSFEIMSCKPSSSSKILSTNNGTVITTFEHATPQYASKLISLLQKLPYVSEYSNPKQLDLREVEALIIQQSSQQQEVSHIQGDKPVEPHTFYYDNHSY